MVDVIPIVFGEEDIDDEMRAFLKQYAEKVSNEQQVEPKKRTLNGKKWNSFCLILGKVSNASNRRRSVADGIGGRKFVLQVISNHLNLVKETKIIDYFKPAAPASPSRNTRKHAAETPSSAPSPKKARMAR